MLLADGKLELVGESYRPVGELGDLAVPETLTALIASRLDALDPADRALLQDAAVVGQSFTPASLAAVTGIADDVLIPRLNGLVRREFLALQADERSPERGQFAFVQALIREVAYGMLARPERKARHLATARYFEALGSDELAGALAGHYRAAHANAAEGPEREALAGQARIALRAAAERAVALGANGQALVLFEQALEVASDPADVAALHERAGDSASLLQEADAAVAHYEVAVERYATLGDRSAEARVATSSGRAQLTSYRFEPGLAYLTAAVERLADLRDDPDYLRLQGQYARALWFNDRDREALAVTDRVLEAAEPADLVDVVADTLITRGSASNEIGRTYEGTGLIEAGYRLAVAYSLPMTQARALINIASFSQDTDPRRSLDAGLEGIALQRRLGVRSFQMVDNTFGAAMRVGDWVLAAELLEPLLGDDLDPAIRCVALSDSVILAAPRGEPVEVLLAAIDAIPDREDDIVKPTTALWTRGVVAYADGRYEVAREAIRKAGDMYSQGLADAYLLAARSALHLGNATWAADDLAVVDGTPRRGRAIDNDRLVIRAGIAALEGRSAEALAGYRQALATWRDLGLVWDEAQLAFDIASLLDPTEPEVRAAAEAGRAHMERLGAHRYIELLDAAMSRPRDPAGSRRAADAEERSRAAARE
jgi:tetratricopeptide (TPR) repeat protein